MSSGKDWNRVYSVPRKSLNVVDRKKNWTYCWDFRLLGYYHAFVFWIWPQASLKNDSARHANILEEPSRSKLHEAGSSKAISSNMVEVDVNLHAEGMLMYESILFWSQFIMLLTYCILLPCWVSEVFVQGCQVLRKHCALVWLVFIHVYSASLENAVELVLFLSFRCVYCFPENCQLSGPNLLASSRCGKLMTIMYFRVLQTLNKLFGVLLAIAAVSRPWKVTKLQCNSSSVVISTPFNVCRRLHKRKTEKAL